MKITAQFSLVTLSSLILFSCSQIAGFGQGEPIGMEELKSGFYSGYPSEGYVEKVITSDSQFQTEWIRIHNNQMENPELPDVNFDTKQVILIMLDTKPTGGYGIKDIEVTEYDGSVWISYTEVQPGNQCITTQALTRPYKLVTIPNTDQKVQIKKMHTEKNSCR